MAAPSLRLAALLLSIALPALGQDQPRVQRLPVPPDMADAVARSSAVGTRMYRQDIAAALASDEMQRRNLFTTDTRLRNWVTVEIGDRVDVLYVGETGSGIAALHRVSVQAGRVGSDSYAAIEPPQPLGEALLAQYNVRMLAREAKIAACSKAYNVIVLPADEGSEGAWHAYLVAATTDSSLLLFGGHHRLTVSRDGTKVEDQRAYTRACLNLKREPGMKFAVVSHLLDPHPTEIHVFLSHLYRINVGVATQSGMLVWVVEGSRIGVLGKSAPPKPQPGPAD